MKFALEPATDNVLLRKWLAALDDCKRGMNQLEFGHHNSALRPIAADD